jgi:hypothetical protein
MRLLLLGGLSFAVIALQVHPLRSQPDSAKAAVERLYHDEAWVTTERLPKGIDVFSASPEVMATYLDTSLVRAILVDRACQRRVGGECNLDFDPVWDSQDPSGSTVRVAATPSPLVVRASIHHVYRDRTTVVTYRMRHTPAGWRIADMGGRGWPSLLRLLNRPSTVSPHRAPDRSSTWA